jgi:hypothetical protein
MSENVGASTSRNPKGLHGLYGDNFTFTLSLGNILDRTSKEHKQRGTPNGTRKQPQDIRYEENHPMK